MCTIHPLSIPSTKSELDLFTVPSTQMVITGNIDQVYLPFTDINNDARRIEFNIPPSHDFIDLSDLRCSIKFKVQKVSASGALENLSGSNGVIPSQYLLNTALSQVEMYIGPKRITPQNPTYHLKAFIDVVFFSTLEAKDTYLKTALWDTDVNRSAAITNSKSVDLYGRLHLDLSQQSKILLPALPIRIVFFLNPEKITFKVAADSTDATKLQCTPKFVLEDIRLHIRKYIVDDSAKLGIESALQTADAKYFFTRSDATTRHIPAGVTKHTIDGILKVIMPRLFIIGIIPNEDLSGSLWKDSFKFSHNNVNFVAAYKGGRILNGLAFEPDYANDLYSREYFEFYRALGQDHSEPIMNISKTDYKNKFCFYAFNLTPDFSNQGVEDGVANLLDSDTIRLELGFSAATTAPLNVVCYALYDNYISIDMHRDVKIDY